MFVYSLRGHFFRELCVFCILPPQKIAKIEIPTLYKHVYLQFSRTIVTIDVETLRKIAKTLNVVGSSNIASWLAWLYPVWRFLLLLQICIRIKLLAAARSLIHAYFWMLLVRFHSISALLHSIVSTDTLALFQQHALAAQLLPTQPERVKAAFLLSSVESIAKLAEQQ